MAQRLREGGFAAEDVHVVGPGGRKQNLVVRLKGTGRKRPVLLIGHLDVVEALREDWTVDPFVFLEKDGYFYGRGTQDMKDGIAIMMTTLLRYRAEGYRPDRDIILALTADEESGTANGVDWLLKNRRDLVDAEFVLNHDGGGVMLENGQCRAGRSHGEREGLRGLRSDGRQSGRPQLRAAARERDLQPRARARSHREPRLPVRAEQRHARVLSSTWRRMRTLRKPAFCAAILQTPPDPQALKQISQDAIYNAARAHDVRRDALVRRPREQRSAADGACERELPHPARPFARKKCGRSWCRSSPTRRVKVRYYNFLTEQFDDVAPNVRGYAPPPLRPDVLKPLGANRGEDVAGRASGAEHGSRSIGQHLHERGGPADVHGERLGAGARRLPRARPGRTPGRAGVLQRRGFLLRVFEGGRVVQSDAVIPAQAGI